MERSQRQPYLAIPEQVGVGQRHGQLVVPVSDGRTQEERPAPFEFQHQAGQEPRTLVIKALLAQAAGLDVAIVVKDGERVPVLEHAGPFIGDAGSGQDVVRTGQLRVAGVRGPLGCQSFPAMVFGSAITVASRLNPLLQTNPAHERNRLQRRDARYRVFLQDVWS